MLKGHKTEIKSFSDEAREIYVQFLRLISLVQLTLGVAELICGGLAVKYIEGTKDSYKITIFIGVFTVGISVSSNTFDLVTSSYCIFVVPTILRYNYVRFGYSYYLLDVCLHYVNKWHLSLDRAIGTFTS